MSETEIDCIIDRARAEDAPDMAAVHVAGWEQAYRGLMPESAFREWTVEARTGMWEEVISQPTPPIHTFVARDGEGIILGFASCGPARDKTFAIDREIYAVYVAEDVQREGIGGYLFVVLLQALRAEGYDRVYTWVPSGNEAAMEFFESMGGYALGESPGPDGIPQIAFAWRNLSEILER